MPFALVVVFLKMPVLTKAVVLSGSIALENGGRPQHMTATGVEVRAQQIGTKQIPAARLRSPGCGISSFAGNRRSGAQAAKRAGRLEVDKQIRGHSGRPGIATQRRRRTTSDPKGRAD
ncbi:predicted protein [Verticillium alfalfae VaMs.102]|uniref:Predicted protein n=1 Tax=Verticillium alfalfae (strain VaMs.102 / ATCC MYA-4576 / FGSC 10136) TaxID=526221 RepID=C9S5W7_VERA1|nr:predicted protein [Verticillium alfalfae VaMs.102]EEY15106.1 predicted protein [Verticillium alfalfae VaMs.102]